MTDSMRISLPVFEGPMDLLLYLVKQDEVDIYDIEINRITDQYLSYLSQMEEMNLEVAGEFLVMAAHLIYIKSRMLLPASEQATDETAEDDNPMWELIQQLVEYKKFKEAALDLEEKRDLQMDIFHRQKLPTPTSKEKPGLGRVGMMDLIHAFQGVLTRLETRQGIEELYDDEFTVNGKIEFILNITQSGTSVPFSKLFTELASRSEIVVTFLALLELIRLKQLRAQQNSQFGEIEIERV